MLPLLVVGMLAGGPVAAQPVHTVTLDEAIERAVERVGPPEEVYHVASDHRGPGKGDTIATLVILSADAATTCVVLRNPDGHEAGLWHLATGPRPSCTEVIVSRALGGAAILGTGHLLAHAGKGKSGRFVVRGILAGISVMVINNIYQATR
jgi:hypothetical protein